MDGMSKELAAYEAVPIAERRIWIASELVQAFEASQLSVPDLAAASERLEAGKVGRAVVRGRALVFKPLGGGCWLVALDAEGKR